MRLHSFHQKARLSAASAIDQLRSMLAKLADGTVTYRLDLSELEDRILLSASPAAVMVESAPTIDMAETASPLDAGSNGLTQTAASTTDSDGATPQSVNEPGVTTGAEFLNLEVALTASDSETGQEFDASDSASSRAAEQVATEVVFIDDSAEDFEQLIADLHAQRDAGRAVDFFVLDSQQDGIDQIAETLQRYSNLDAVHIVSHGSTGAVKLGATWLRIGSLDAYAGTIAGWGSAISTDGDLLIYGCDLAASSRGEMLVDSIAALTGADVAASTDDTGSALRGGDWDLEFHSGSLETDVVFTEQLQTDWQGLLATSETHYFLTGSGIPQAELTQPIPTGTAVPDYDSGRDAGAGTLVDKGGSGFAESDPVKHQEWRLASGGFTIDGPASLTVYSAIKDFNTTKGATVHAYLLDVANNGSDPQLIASDTITRGTWNSTGDFVEDTFDFGNVTRTFSGNRRMHVKIVVDGSSEDDMIFAYDSVFYRSHLKVGITTSNGDPVITPGGSPLNYTENDAATEVDSGLSLSDDDTNLEWATVQITGGFLSSEDILVFSDTLPAGITMESDAATGQIVFYGSSSVSNYESVLKLVRYQNTSEQPDTGARTVTFEVYDGQNLSTVTQDINITSVNDQPAVAANAADTALEDQSIVYTHAQMLSLIGASDVDNSNAELTVNITGLTNATFNKTGSGTGTTYTFNSTQPQHSNGFTVTFNYEVLDLEPLSASGGPATITVLAVNDEPSFTTLGNQTVDEDTGLHSVGGFASAMPGGGADESGQTFSYMVSANVPSLFSVLPAIAPSGTLTYTLAPDAIGTTTVTVSVTDNGGTANGGDDTSPDQTFDIIVNNANNDDVFLLTNNPLNLNEGSTGSIGAALLEVADPDLPPTSSLSFTVTVSPTLGQLELTTAAGMGISSFTQDDINTGKLVYVHGGAEAPLTDSFTFTATDGIGSPTGPHVFNINISNVNDAPVNSTPGAQATPQDTPLMFNTANGNLVSISDEDAGAAVVEVTLTVTNGTATLNMPTAVGTPAGPEALIPSTTGQTQSEPAIARAANGNYVVVWGGKVSGDDPGIGYQVFDANHDPIGTEGRANSTKPDTQDEPSVAMDDAGNFVIAWTSDLQDGDARGVYAQRFDSLGNAVGGEFLVNTVTLNKQQTPAVAMDADGDFVIVWEDHAQDGSNEGVFARRYNSLGVAQDPVEIQVNTFTTGKQNIPDVAMDANGNFTIVWMSKGQDGGDGQEGVYGRQFDAAGNPLGGEFLVNTVTAKAQENPSIAMDVNGNFVVVYSSKDLDGSSRGVFGQLFDSAANKIGPTEFQVSTFTTLDQQNPSVSMDADGDFVVVWESVNQDNPGDFLTGIYAQQFDKTGAPVGSETLINNTVTDTQKDSAVAMDANGSFVVVWQGDSLDTGDIFARRYDIPAPPLTFTTGDGAADSLMTFTGNITDINNALDGITFTPDLGFTGLATIDITTDDLGNTGPGGARQDMDTVNINVTGGNTAPTITSNGGGSTAALNVAENTTAVTTVTATDSDLPAQTLMYSISGGADQTLFSIDSGSGVLTFASAPDFETPTDANTDNVYEVTVLASDGQGGTDTQDISVTVTAVNDNSPTIISNGGGVTASINVFENTTAATTVSATDADLPAQTLTYSISGGADAAEFNINSGSGVLTFVSAPDFASPTDANTDNVYEVTVQVSDGQGGFDTQDISVTVSATPSLTPTGEFLVNDTVTDQQVTSGQNRGSQQAVSLAADSSYVVVWTSLNQDGSGQGVYAQRFDTNGSALTAEFRVNQTTASDQQWARVASAADGSFVVTWTSNQGASQDVYYRRFAANGTALTAELVASTTTSGSQTNSVIDMDVNGDFVIAWQGNGTGDSTGIFAQRFNQSGTKVGSEFRVNTATSGTQSDPSVSVNGSRDFVIAWEDVGVIKAQRYNSGGVSQGSEITVDSNLLGVSDRPAVGLADDGSFVVVWSDQPVLSSFDISGQRFNASGNTVGGEFTVNTTTSSDQVAPSIAMSSNGDFIVSWEGNGTGDSSGILGQKYLANGTAQGAEFRVNQTTTGTQQFTSLAMVDLDNYVVVWSGNGNQAGEVDSSGVFARQYGNAAGNTSPIANAGGPYVISEGNSVDLDGSASSDPDADPLTYVWDLDNDGNFGEAGEPTTVSPTVSWTTLQSFGITNNGIYTIGLQVSDGNGGVDSATTMLTVNNVSPAITSSASAGVPENTTAVLTVTATDPVDAVSYSLTGGDDQGFFTINSTTGVLSFTTAPDFESPADNDGNNIYQVEVTAADGDGGSDVQAINVTVTDGNDETPVITPGQAFNVSESATNGTSLGSVIATDADAGTTFSNWQITGGNAAGVFGINASTGQLTVANRANLDFETTTSYVLSIAVSDGVNTLATQTVAITVLDQNDETPVVTPGQTFNVSESATNGTSLGNVVATDADAATTFSNWQIIGGNAAGVFGINASTGLLTVANRTNLDYETTTSYVLSIAVSDGVNTSASQTVAINVLDQNDETPVITPGQAFNVSESATNGTSLGSVIATDADAATTFSNWQITGGNAAGVFGINASTGQLTVADNSTLNFEILSTYTLNVRTQDGAGNTGSGIVFVNVSNTNETPTTSGLSDVVVNEGSADFLINLKTAFSDPETPSPDLSYSITSNSNPAIFSGTPIIGGNLILKFAANANGNAIVTVRATDPQGLFATASFTVTVLPVTNPPVSAADSYLVLSDRLTVPPGDGVLANDSDPDGDPLTALLITGPAHGSLVLLSNGGFTYTPDEDFRGIDTFAYQAFDGASTGLPRTVTLNVIRVVALPPAPSVDTSPVIETVTSEVTAESEAPAVSVNAPLAVTEYVNLASAIDDSTTATSSSNADSAERTEEELIAVETESDFFRIDSDRLELRDATSVKVSTPDLEGLVTASPESENDFRNSLRFDGEDLSYLVGAEFIQKLEQVEDGFEFDGAIPEWATGTAVATTASLSVGYIMWMLRGGYVLASVLSTMPVWQHIDPLPVLAALEAADDDDDESLETMIDRASSESDDLEISVADDEVTDDERKDEIV